MSSRVNLDRPQPFLADPIELLMTTETETPADHIIKNFDGDFKFVLTDFGQDVILQVRIREHKSSRDGSTVSETAWVTSDTFNKTGEHVVPLSRNCEYRCETSSAGSRVFVADAQWSGVM